METTTPTRLTVGGRRVTEEDFLEALRGNEPSASRLLVQQIRSDRESGRSLGLTLLSRAYYGPMIRFIERQLKGDRESASEVWNDVLMRVHERIDRFDPAKSAFRTWLYNQAMYASVDRLRRLAREDRAQGGDIEPITFLDPPPLLSARETRSARRAFARLTETQRHLLWYTKIAGYHPVELRREGLTTVPADQVKVYVNRAAAKFREFYEEELRRSGVD